MIFDMIFATIRKIIYHKFSVPTGSVKTRWLGGSLIVYRNNTGMLGSGFISACLENR